MGSEPPLLRPPSASKRKRQASYNLEPELAEDPRDDDATEHHYPKRSRQSNPGNDPESPEKQSPTQKRNVRRKKGLHGLSMLSMQQADGDQIEDQSQTRASKFQEGSLTDKPSEKPPSAFTRIMRTDSGNSVQVDTLMEDYHNDNLPSPDDEVQPVGLDLQSTPVLNGKGENTGLSRFGRHFAQNFHPVALWNRMWSESKEELTRQNMEEAERKARMKAEAEARYAELKRTGQFIFEPVGTVRTSSAQAEATPRDSGISMPSEVATSAKHLRSTSATSNVTDDSSFGNEQPSTVEKAAKTLKSRLRFTRPSLSNIRDSLRRVGSEINLSASLTHRESSSSLSPVKADVENSTLKRSQSRYDLKKQQKLTKRVSDLEYKLQQARHELEEALVAASPMPRLSNKYERFTPVSSVKRPTYMSGRLPSLPSERLLGFKSPATVSGNDIHVDSDTVNISNMNFDESELEDQETIKLRKPTVRPRLSSLFRPNNPQYTPSPEKQQAEQESAANMSGTMDNIQPDVTVTTTRFDESVNENVESDTGSTTQAVSNYASLDAKLKAVEQNAKLARKLARSKKRKPALSEADKLYKPGNTTDEESGRDEAPKKRRKSSGSKASGGGHGKNASTTRHDTRASSVKDKTHAHGHGDTLLTSTEQTTEDEILGNANLHGRSLIHGFISADEDIRTSQRTSLESQGHSLEPLIEEDEPVTTTVTKIPLKDVPSKPTAKATPARHVRILRARSSSPNKLSRVAEPSNQDAVTISGNAESQTTNGRRRRSQSPPSKVSEESTEDEIITAIPGSNGVPKLPKDPYTGIFEEHMRSTEGTVYGGSPRKSALNGKNNGKEAFDWPDDVF